MKTPRARSLNARAAAARVCLLFACVDQPAGLCSFSLNRQHRQHRGNTLRFPDAPVTAPPRLRVPPGLMGERRLGKTPAAYLAKTMLNAAAMAPVMSYFQHGGARAWYPTEHALLDNYVGAWATFLFLNFFTDLIGIAESACGCARGDAPFRV